MTVHTTRDSGEHNRPMTVVGVIIAVVGWLCVVAFVWIFPLPAVAFVGLIITLYGIRTFVKHAGPNCQRK